MAGEMAEARTAERKQKAGFLLTPAQILQAPAPADVNTPTVASDRHCGDLWLGLDFRTKKAWFTADQRRM